ncbi:MAG: hypothetical protein AABX74_04350 [Nanoarchaeota archaeon]
MNSYKRINGFYVKKDEEPLIKYLVPEHCIDEDLGEKGIDASYAKRFLQNELNGILNSFVNGGFSNKGYLFYPLIKDVSKENKSRLMRLKKVAMFLKDNGHDFSHSLGKFRNEINSRNFSVVLSALYEDLYKLDIKNTKTKKKAICKEFNIADHKKDGNYLAPLMELKEYANSRLRPYLSGFYLHGSFATKDYIKGWSDVDTLSIISRETIKNPKKLLELRSRLYCARKFFYSIDPLQHHGSMVISEYEMENYCQYYFPVTVFDYSLSLLKNDKAMDFKVADCKKEAIGKLFWFVSYFRQLNCEKRYRFNSHDTKNLLHFVTLFPALYLQAKGTPTYKKFSFDKAKKDFKEEDWKVVDYVSSLRSDWRSFVTLPLIKPLANINPLLCYQVNAKIIDIFGGVGKKNSIDAKRLVENMFSLSEQAWRKIRKNADKI